MQGYSYCSRHPSERNGLILTRAIAVKAYDAFQQIRENADSSTERNKQLEDNTRAARDLSVNLSSPSTSQATIDPVTQLSMNCARKAEELLELLEYVRGNGKTISTAHASFRVWRKQNEIERLHSSLAQSRVTLNEMISQKLLSSVDLLALAQSRDSKDLGSSMQKLISDLVEHRRAQEVHNSRLDSRVESINHDMHLGFNETSGKVDSISHEMQLRFTEAERRAMRDKLLASLFFPEIDQRQSEIKEPAPETLNWLFKSTFDESDESDESDQELISSVKWSNFKQWLRDDSSTYWISGKAGSGKSTLMAHIVNDGRTHQELQTWSTGYKLETLSFFFWRTGSQLQNSVLGLLRSLLYQLCSLQPTISDIIISRLPLATGMIPTWTERRLLEYTSEIIQSCKGFRFCIFVDGLDEFAGSYDYLVDCIEQLQAFSNVKFCVSSRPELELVQRLRGLKTLRLQDLNKSDIRKFVTQSLNKTKCKHLTGTVVDQAEGVFLWASLVTQSLIKGSKAGDSEEILRQRLNSLPQDMNLLFKRMLSEIEPVYRGSLAFYIQLTMLATKYRMWYFPTISIITVARLGGPVDSYEEFSRECERTETQIATQSAGLLEVFNTPYLDINKKQWERSTAKVISRQPRFTIGAEGLDRVRCPDDEPFPTMLNYEARYMGWIHKSAFEFISQVGSETALPIELSLSLEELHQRIGNSIINYIVAAPSDAEPPRFSDTAWRPLAVDRFEPLFFLAINYYDAYPKAFSNVLDRLYHLCAKYNLNEIYTLGRTYRWDLSDYHQITGTSKFWIELPRLKSYVLSQFHRILGDPACDIIIAIHIDDSFISFYLGSLIKNSEVSSPLLEVLSENLLQRTLQRLENSGTTKAVKYRCIGMKRTSPSSSPVDFWKGLSCATWKKQDAEVPMVIIRVLISTLGCVLQGIATHSNLPVLMPQPLSRLMRITDLYVGLEIPLTHLFIQLSAEALVVAMRSLADTRKTGYTKETGLLGNHVSANEVPGAVHILCIPLKSQMLGVSRNEIQREVGWQGDWNQRWDSYVELDASEFIRLRPNPVTSDDLLALVAYTRPILFQLSLISYGVYRFEIAPGTKQLREQVCEMLLQDVKSPEQGLDRDQQRIAAECVRAGLLNPSLDKLEEDGDSSEDE
ncbi:hypothetical protein RRF57_006235 [Xylaria bambusicola]|uniref:NACHT domain-containing protein n=1 Tax=Xylaria bambusicola TaxID=326684 RepID=A0AAN7UDY8_9PEZI